MSIKVQFEDFLYIQFDENLKILKFKGNSSKHFNISGDKITGKHISGLFFSQTVEKLNNFISSPDSKSLTLVVCTENNSNLKLEIAKIDEYGNYECFGTDIGEYIQQINDFEKLFENATDAIFFGDNDGKYIFVNQTAVELTGYEKQDFNSMKMKDLFSDDVLNKEPLRYDLILSGHTVTKIRKIRRKDGSTVIVEMKSKMLENGRLQSIIRDLSDQVMLSERLKQSEELYKTVFNNIPMGIFHLDPESVIVDCNDIFVNIMGSSKEKLVGFNMLSQLQDEQMRIAVEKMLIEGEGSYEGNYKSVTGGKVTPIRVLFKSIGDSTNRICGGVGIVENISERKAFENELIHAKEKAESADKLKSYFLTQVSHEIRTPVNTILSFSSLIREELEGKLSSDLSSSFEVINIAGERITRTIDQLINMSQIKAGAFEIFPRQLELKSKILQNLYKEYRIHALKKNLGFDLITDRSELPVFGDEYTVTQIIANLVDNAIKYTFKGKITINGIRKNGNSIVEVFDTGIGISEEYLDSIFEPFSQEEQGYTRKFEGNGLGLSLVKNYCELNDAKIEIESTKGTGSIFRVIFKSAN